MAKNTKKFGDARDNADYRGQKSTMPARHRPGKKYAGGRALRRAYRRLGEDQQTQQHGKGADHGLNKIGAIGYTTPGAMRT